jgi:hypothetical protein
MTSARSIASAAAVAALFALGCGGNPAAPQGNYGTIVGVVKSSSGPVAGATVIAAQVLKAQTAADGKYTIQIVPIDSPTSHTTVTCHAAGYQDPTPDQVVVTAGKQVEADFTLSH